MLALIILSYCVAFLGIILIGLFANTVRGTEKKRNIAVTVGSILIFIGAYWCSGLLMYSTPFDYHSTKYSVTYKIEQVYTNETLVKTDTIYTIKRKN